MGFLHRLRVFNFRCVTIMERMILWGIVIVLLLLQIFSMVRKSFYVPQPGNTISIMDLVEFSALPPYVVSSYLDGLNSNLTTYLPTVTNDMSMYTSTLTHLLSTAMLTSQFNTPTTSNVVQTSNVAPTSNVASNVALVYSGILSLSCPTGYVNIVGMCVPGQCPVGSTNSLGNCITPTGTMFTISKNTSIITVTSLPCIDNILTNTVSNQSFCVPLCPENISTPFICTPS